MGFMDFLKDMGGQLVEHAQKIQICVSVVESENLSDSELVKEIKKYNESQGSFFGYQSTFFKDNDNTRSMTSSVQRAALIKVANDRGLGR